MQKQEMSRRKEERRTEIDTVKIGIDRPVYAQTLNISKSGICLETDLYLQEGQHHFIYSTISTSILDQDRYHGEVRWREKIDDSFSGRYRYGIYFSALNRPRSVNANSKRFFDIVEPQHLS